MVMYLYLLVDTMEQVFLRQVMDPPPSRGFKWEKVTDLTKASTFATSNAAMEALASYPCKDTAMVRAVYVTNPQKCTIGMEA